VLDLVWSWRALPLSEADRAMLEYVEIIAVTPSAATQKDVAALRQAGLSDEEIFEIVMVTAYYALRCRMADGLGVELDARVSHDRTLVEAFAYRGTADGVSENG
jgi:alkylhydroperoxidase family enzyme